jgi:serine/threonine protein kinase
MSSGSPHYTTTKPLAQKDDTVGTAHPTDGEPIRNSDHTKQTRASGAPRPVSPETVVLPAIGEYAVIRKIGEGGMGAVYLAEDPKLGRKVALKTMKTELAVDPTNRERFEREARATAAVEHENIVPIWGVGEAADGTPYIAMPFLQGEMLADRLNRHPVAGLGLLLKVAREVADGLAAAHARGLIHRDIKPGNIWLEGDLAARNLNDQVRRCKILDFGLARSVCSEDTQLTSTGAAVGTPAFMAPEQALGEKVDHRADLFSLGITLYRMATGKAPFDGATGVAVMVAVTTTNPPPVSALNPNLPPAVGALIDRLLNKDPDRRPQSAAEVATTVRQIVRYIQSRNSAPAPSAPVVVAPSVPAAPADSLTPPVPKWEEAIDTRPLCAIKTPGPRARSAPEPEQDESKRARSPKRKARKSADRGRMRWYIAGGVLGLFTLVALAVAILRFETGEGTLVVEIADPNVEARFRNGTLVLVGPDGKDRYTLSPTERNKKIAPGPYTVRVQGADGLVIDTPEFALKKGDKVAVRVTLVPAVAKAPEPPKVANLDVDRKAAEYALSIGGAIRINKEGPEVRSATDLPKEPFRLTGVFLGDNKQVTDAGLAIFRDCRNITELNLNGTAVTDEGMKHFRNSPDLTSLHIWLTRVGDAGLVHLKGSKNITSLGLFATQVSDVGLSYFKDNKKLDWLSVGGCPNVTDAGLATFKGCAELHALFLDSSPVGDAGLAHFTDSKELTMLCVSGTRITDKGLDRIKGYKKLNHLNLFTTQVSPAKVVELAKALPQCQIDGKESNGEPKK